MSAAWPSEAVRSETWRKAKAAALEKWQTGSADTTQMLMCVNAALEAVVPDLLAAHPETDDGAGAPPDLTAPEVATFTPAPSSSALVLNRDAVAEVLDPQLHAWHFERKRCVCGIAYSNGHVDHMLDLIVALARPENEVREEIAKGIEDSRHAHCASGMHQPCSVCWALGEAAHHVRLGPIS